MQTNDYKNKQIQIIVNLINTRKFEEVLNKAKPLIKKFPKEYIFYNAAGMSLINLERYEEAIEILNNAKFLDQSNIFVLNNLGLAHFFLKNYDISLEHFNRALKTAPYFLNSLINLANLKKTLNQNDEALSIYKVAIKYHSKDYFLHFSIGTLYQITGDFERANSHFEKCLLLNPYYTEVDGLISLSKKYKSEDDQHLQSLKNKISDDKFTELQKMHLHFALGKAFNDLENFNDSFANYKKANDIKDKKINYSFKLDNQIIDNVQNQFNSSLNLSIQNNISDKKIIFIVGMPRSGTSLIEQVLSSHDKVYGAGELTFLTEAIYKEFIINKKTNPEFKIDHVTEQNLMNIQEFYYNDLNKFNYSEEYIVDKAPLNFRWLGFIPKIFPNSYIIHANRDPVDICWSNYKQNFSSSNLGYAYNLDNIASFYNSYQNTMNYWFKNKDIKIHDVNYETFTNSFDDGVKKLLSFCNLEWSQKCVEFYKNKKEVKTSSLAQVRQPIYKTSIASWKNYSDKLENLIKKIS
jgi:tetratricopeptide (TPR) repeat protein